MKKMIMLVMSGIACFMVANATAMMVVKKRQLVPKIRNNSQNSINRYKDIINDQQMKN